MALMREVSDKLTGNVAFGCQIASEDCSRDG